MSLNISPRKIASFENRLGTDGCDSLTTSVASGSQGEVAQPENPGKGRDNRHAGNLVGLASEVDCQEVRQQRVPCTGSPTDGDGDYCECSSIRQRKPKLGISADPGCSR